MLKIKRKADNISKQRNRLTNIAKKFKSSQVTLAVAKAQLKTWQGQLAALKKVFGGEIEEVMAKIGPVQAEQDSIKHHINS